MKNLENKCWAIWLLFLFLLAAPFLLSGCKSQKPLTQKEIQTNTVTETLHDTTFIKEADSSAIRALIECQNGKPVLKEVIKTRSGTRMPPPTLSLKDNILNCDCYADSLKLYAFWKSKQSTATTYKEKPVYIERQLTWWQTTLMWIGGISLAGLFIALLAVIKNPLKYLKK